MRKVIVIIAFAVMVLMLPSCRQEQKKKVGISVLTMTNPFFGRSPTLQGRHGEGRQEVIVVDPDGTPGKRTRWRKI